MSDTIIATIISAAVTLMVCVVTNYAQNKRTIALIEYKLDELKKQVEKHNSVIVRTYELEKQSAVMDEAMKVCQHRISDIESKVG